MQFYSYENKHCKTLKRDLLMAKSILMNCCMGCSVHTLAECWAASQKSCDKISRYLMSWSCHCYSTRIDYYQAWTTETAVKNIASLFWMLFAHWATTTMLPPLHVDLSFPRYWEQMPPPLNCNDAVPICHWPVSLCCFRPCCRFHRLIGVAVPTVLSPPVDCCHFGPRLLLLFLSLPWFVAALSPPIDWCCYFRCHLRCCRRRHQLPFLFLSPPVDCRHCCFCHPLVGCRCCCCRRSIVSFRYFSFGSYGCCHCCCQ